MKRTIAVAAALLMLATACSDDATESTLVGGSDGFDPDRVQFAASLRRFDACAQVLEYFHDEALDRVGPYGLDSGGGFFPVPFAEPDIAVAEEALDFAPAPATGADGAFREGVDFSGSNVQVAGVDEPDIVKTDGSRILTLINQTLTYVDVSAGRARRMGSLTLPGWDHRFFMDGDTAFVLARGDGFAIAFDVAESVLPPFGGAQTLLFEVDLSDPEDMTVTRTMQIDGNYLSARLVDGIVRVVVSAFPSDLPFVYPSTASAEDFALEANRGIIEDSTIDDWLPNYALFEGTDGDLIGSGLLIDCRGVHRPAEFSGFDTLAVTTFEMDEGLTAPEGTAVVAQGETIYASTENLYVATNVWVPSTAWGTDEVARIEEDYSTALHKFDIRGREARYQASGSVRGHLLNQFAMDEYDGYLRVATTDGPPWGFDDSSESFVTILQERDERLQEVGQVGDMGKGERIFSVRFLGEAAYVVTFRQVDPFYIVDLSDPEAPEVTGELKIAGYSGYLHPISDDRIMGIGQDATEDGFTTGAKATVFDVSDPRNPRELGTWTMDGASSDVEWDHLAFLFWPPEEIAVVPIQNWQEDFYGAVVLKTDDGVREFGRIVHSPDGVALPSSDCRELTLDEILALDPGAEVDDGVIISVCGEGQDVSGGTGYSCESLSFEDAVLLAAEEDIDLTTIMEEGDRLVVCFPEFFGGDRYRSPVLRSLVIGDQIWTLSWEALQSNSIDDLDFGEYVPLG